MRLFSGIDSEEFYLQEFTLHSVFDTPVRFLLLLSSYYIFVLLERLFWENSETWLLPPRLFFFFFRLIEHSLVRVYFSQWGIIDREKRRVVRKKRVGQWRYPANAGARGLFPTTTRKEEDERKKNEKRVMRYTDRKSERALMARDSGGFEI